MTAPAPKFSSPNRKTLNLSQAAKYRQMGREMMVKVLVNLGIIAGGLVALSQLCPYYLAQKEKLTGLKDAAQEAQARVNQLKANQKQDSAPQSIERIAQEDANLIRPDQRRIVWVKPEGTDEMQTDVAPASSPLPQPEANP
jgi:hypothetical protein